MSEPKYPKTIVDGELGKYCHYCQVWHPRSGYYALPDRWLCKVRHYNRVEKYLAAIKARGDYPKFLKRRAAATAKHVARLRREDIKKLKMRRMLNAAKRRARARGIEFAISEVDFPGWRTQQVCPVFPWVSLNWSRGQQSSDSPTIDRINPRRGYVPTNVRIICWRANDLKRDASPAELAALANDAVRVAA